jgi:hypothetical protein
MALKGDPALPRIQVLDILLKAGAKPIVDWETGCRMGGRGWAPDPQIQTLLKSYVK